MEEFLKRRILGNFEKKIREESLVAINISQKPREEFLKGRFLGRNLKKDRAECLVAEILPKNG